jgi:hypothetical protein
MTQDFDVALAVQLLIDPVAQGTIMGACLFALSIAVKKHKALLTRSS